MLTSAMCIPFIPFSHLTATREENGYPCLIPDFRGNLLSLSVLYHVDYRNFQYGLINKIASISSFFWTIVMKAFGLGDCVLESLYAHRQFPCLVGLTFVPNPVSSEKH